MSEIPITLRRECDPTTGQVYYEVYVGPHDHVCARRQRYWIGKDCDEDTAFWQALAFANGAHSALETASGLTARFLSPAPVINNLPKGNQKA